jgi:hypothetical protein
LDYPTFPDHLNQCAPLRAANEKATDTHRVVFVEHAADQHPHLSHHRRSLQTERSPATSSHVGDATETWGVHAGYEERDQAALGEAGHGAISAARPEDELRLHLRRDLPISRENCRPNHNWEHPQVNVGAAAGVIGRGLEHYQMTTRAGSAQVIFKFYYGRSVAIENDHSTYRIAWRPLHCIRVLLSLLMNFLRYFRP